jgi:hypothetical protein
MPFASLMKDNVEIQKVDGTQIAGLKASVQGKKIFMNAGSIVLESGDIVIRKPSIGREEHYRIVDTGFHEAFHGIPANYQMTVERIEPVSSADEITEQRRTALFKQWDEIGVDIIKGDLVNGGIRYVGGPPATRRLAMQWVQMKDAERQAKAGHHINVTGDNSRVNFHSTDNSVNTIVGGDLVAKIHDALNGGVADAVKRAELQELLKAVAASKDKNGFWSNYQRFVAGAADYMTLLTPFLPSLTALASNFGS